MKDYYEEVFFLVSIVSNNIEKEIRVKQYIFKGQIGKFCYQGMCLKLGLNEFREL